MVDPVLAHVGGRIRLYRKTIGMSMEELAERIHKSKGSVSKYESGLVAVDVKTLCHIAEALHIAPYHLLDFTPKQREQLSSPANNPFVKAERLYLYHMDRQAVHVSVLKLDAVEEESPARATLFYKVKDPNSPSFMEPCDCIYHGQMFTHDMVLCFVLRNHYNPVENILLNFVIPMRKADVLYGMISGLTVDPLAPTAHKMLLSAEPMTIDGKLRMCLTIQPETFKEMKRGNKLFIPTR